jgi:uncharacterized protein YndB with AHSA1/START domain
MDMSVKAVERAADRTLEIVRVFDAPASLLFLAYSKPEHIKRWYGPKTWPVTTCEMDFRVGGKFHFAMTGPKGEAGPPFGGTYHEIVPNRKIVYDQGFEAPGSGRMLVSVVLEENAGQTTLTVTTVFDTIAIKDEYLKMGMKEGMHSGFDNLVELVAEMQSKR